LTENYFVVDPKEPLPGCLSVVASASQLDRLGLVEKNREVKRFLTRAYLSDHIPLCGSIENIISRKPYHLLKVNEDPLSIYLHHGGRNAIYYDLKPDENGSLEYIEVEIEAELPSSTFSPARTAANELLDSLQREIWIPLSLMRIDLYIKGEPDPLAHQLILPYPGGLKIGPLGGIHQYPAFSFYEAVLREGILSTSPYYRLLCAYRLYEGINKLRAWMKSICDKLKITDKLPKDPKVNKELLKGFGLDKKFIGSVKNIGDLWKHYSELRNRVAHFFLKDDSPPLHFSHGPTYYQYSLAGAILLYHSNIAFNELSQFFNQKLNSALLRGSILPLKENRDQFIIRSIVPNHANAADPKRPRG
jgi:hypothetical protein